MTSETTPASGLERAEALLKQRLGGRLRKVRVLMGDGGVVLQGQAVSYYAKQMAQHVVMDALGLPIRCNQIEVQGTPPLLEAVGEK